MSEKAATFKKLAAFSFPSHQPISHLAQPSNAQVWYKYKCGYTKDCWSV